MSSITITDITETINNNDIELKEHDREQNQQFEEENIIIDEKGEETDAENSDEDENKKLINSSTTSKKELNKTNTIIKKKKKKLRKDINKDDYKGYSSSEDIENIKSKKDTKINELNEITSKLSSTNTIIRRKPKKLIDKYINNEENKARLKRGQSEPKDVIKENDNYINNNNKTNNKKTWWPFNKYKLYNRQIQTDGELDNKKTDKESSDEFWKSSSFRKNKKKINKSETKLNTNIIPIENKPDIIINESKQLIKSIISKEILTDEITVEIIHEIKTINEDSISWKQFKLDNYEDYLKFINSRNRCICFFITFTIYLGLGALTIRFIEGTFENFYKCGVKRVKRDFIDYLWNKRYDNEYEWKSYARKTLLNFENELQNAFEAGMKSYSGQQSWSFINSFIYCLTVVTTIGYGNISPSTNTGRAFTMVYALFGIPLFLIVLADFGKMFTRGIKFLWAYVRRLYYTGSCRKVRRTAPVQEVMKGVKLVYDVASNLRRPSQMVSPEEQRNMAAFAKHLETPGTGAATPALSSYEIDEEFNLPISLALLILLIYIFAGAALFCSWENWTFFESFYFVFISMSTIGFGDVVPQHQKFMMITIVYLLFGLALTSMCINVVQEKLSDSFRQASVKLGATIGFQVQEDTGCVDAIPAERSEIPEVHKSSTKSKQS